MTSDPKRVHQPGDKAESSSGEVLQRHLLAENGLEDTVDTAFKPTKKDHSASVDQIAKTEILVEETGKEIDGKKATQAQETTEYQSDTDRPFSEAAFSVNQPTEAFQYTPGQPGSYRIKSNVASTTIPKFIGDYEIKRVLGRGGMGVVYLAHQRSLKRDVALKMVLEGQHASDNLRDRFKAEARAVAKLQHQRIVQVFEVGEHEGMPYFSLEFVEGPSLDCRLNKIPITAKEAASITEKICRAMQYAHDRGILHRDLKPANILTTPSGEPKISDFGLAKQIDDDDSAMTRTGTVMGTPSYMSPEQAQGLSDELTPQSDQYSVGAILYELLTGRAPFVGTKTYDTLSQVIHKEPVPPCHLQPGIESDIDTICLKALQKNPQKRYQNCDAMADDLARFLRGEPIHARPVGMPERFWRWCKRNPLIALPSASAVALLIVSATVSTLSFLQISAQAAVIVQERDNVEQQRDQAEQQRAVAQQNEIKAKLEEAKAVREREEAERQRILADEARLQAEKNQQLAERQALLALQNIQLVVTEVDDRLAKEPGMSDIRIGLLEVIEKKWDELDLALAGGVQGEAIPTQMAVRGKIADAWNSVDRISQSSAQYEKIYQQAHDRLLVKNRSDASRFNLALICVRWAPIKQRLTGDPEESAKLIDESITILREIRKDPRPQPGSPKSFQIADALQQSLMRSASALLKVGNRSAAEIRYREASETCEQVLQEIANDTPWYQALPEANRSLIRKYYEQSHDLANAGLANVLCRFNRADEAVVIYEKIVATRRIGLELSPQDRNARDQLALQLRNYGQHMLRIGRSEEAVRLIGQAHDLTEMNLADDPTSAAFKRAHSHSLYYLAVARAEIGQEKDALVLLERSRVVRKDLCEASSDQANKVNLMLSLGRLGDMDNTKVLVDELTMSDKNDPDLRLDIARALSQLSSHRVEPTERSELIESALIALERAVKEGLVDPFAFSSEVDLKPLRASSRFTDLVKSLEKSQE